jgi:hypothetical protein
MGDEVIDVAATDADDLLAELEGSYAPPGEDSAPEIRSPTPSRRSRTPTPPTPHPLAPTVQRVVHTHSIPHI